MKSSLDSRFFSRFYPVCVALVLLFLAGCKAPERMADRLAEPEPPGQEFRGAWVATVVNLDWPASGTRTVAEQKRDAVELLDSLNAIGINAVLLQVRAEADALFASSYDPWSYWLTGEQGRAPDPFYDPLSFFIREAHRRGMELHAWLNPLRVERYRNGYALSGNNISRREPGWVLVFESDELVRYTMLDPGLPEVRDYISSVVTDIIRRYDVDGIHFDDYFYPYTPAVSGEDSLTFLRHDRGHRDIHEWRRDNINRLVAQVHDSIQALAPHVSFGISPFGIRKNSDAGTNGFEGYHGLYADAEAWLDQRIIDYIAPQLYFEPGHEKADYARLLHYWSDLADVHGRHLYVGLSPYRMMPPFDWSTEQAAEQLFLNRDNDRVQGNIYFRATHLLEDPKGYTRMIRDKLHRNPALTPSMPWKSRIAPPPVDEVFVSRSGDGRVILTWNRPQGYGVHETPARYAVYRIGPGSQEYEWLEAWNSTLPRNRDSETGHETGKHHRVDRIDVGNMNRNRRGGNDIDDAMRESVVSVRNRVEVTGRREFEDRRMMSRCGDNVRPTFFVITAVSRNSIESEPVIVRLACE
ncbi:family 10 glycosylhydrolase [Balneolales bacterium ANBcel1]|nr:family 10 glycosylhydrolase [Balneolales bacterium ANBcel1]